MFKIFWDPSLFKKIPWTLAIKGFCSNMPPRNHPIPTVRDQVQIWARYRVKAWLSSKNNRREIKIMLVSEQSTGVLLCFQSFFLPPGGCESLNPSLILEDVYTAMFFWLTILYILALEVSSATWCRRVAIRNGSPKIFWKTMLCCVWWMSCHRVLSLLIIGALVALAVCSSLDGQT